MGPRSMSTAGQTVLGIITNRRFREFFCKLLKELSFCIISNFNVMDLLRITVELTYTRGEMDFPGIKITFENQRVFFCYFLWYTFLNFSNLHFEPIKLLLQLYH